MDVIRDIRTNYKDFLARLFIDILLLWMRFVDRIYRMKNGPSVAAKSKEERSHHKSQQLLQDSLRQRNEDKKEKSSQWTDDVDEMNSKQQKTKDVKEVKEDSLLRRTEEMPPWLRNGRPSFHYSESLEEVNSSILDSTHDLGRQISALSDYFSDDEDLANEWETAKCDKAIATSLAIAENLERRGSTDFGEARSTYESFCEGLEKLRDVFLEILEEWKKRNEESVRNLRGYVPIDVHQRKSAEWNRYAVDTMDLTDDLEGSGPSVFNENLVGSTSRLDESLRECKCGLEQHRQMLVTHEHLMQQRNTLNHRMLREYSETKKLLILLEKKRMELAAKVNDQELTSLNDSCKDLYAQQLQLRDECKSLTRDVVARRKNIKKGFGIVRAAFDELDSCLRGESEILKIWSREEVPKFMQIQKEACELKRQFDERKTVVSEMECGLYVAKLTKCLHLQAEASGHFLEKWKTLSRRAEDILVQKYLDFDEHEERCFEWKDFSELDEFRKEYERHLEAFQEYVPRICQIYERRSPSSTGIFGQKTENVEFKKFYQNYKRKMKAIEEDYSGLESSRMDCCQEIENYRGLHEALLCLMKKHRQIESQLREEESVIQKTKEKLQEDLDSVQSHLRSNQWKQLTEEKRQIMEVLNRIEEQLNESHHTFELYERSFTDAKDIIEEIHKAQVLRRHFERMKYFVDEWEQQKRYEKIFDLISYVENFQAIDNPHKMKLEAHEERVHFLEKRLSKIVELHQENCSTYLNPWLAYSREYDESEKEPLSFDEIAKGYKTWFSYCRIVSRGLKDFKKEFTARHKQLHSVNEALSPLNAQQYSHPETESVSSIKERFDVYFHRAENDCRSFEQVLADFRPMFDQYSELKMGHRCLIKTLAVERNSSDKLTEKLENCKGLFREHRDHLECRRIGIKIEELFNSMKDILFITAEESESQVKSLDVETGLLIHNFIELSGRHFSDITQLQIPNLREFLISLDRFEQKLKDSEEKLDSCDKTLMKEEKTVHEFYNSVHLLTEFLNHTSERTKIFETELEAGAELLHVSQSFIEGYSNQEKSFNTHLGESKWSLAAFEDAFNCAEKKANELDKLFIWYCSEFGSSASGESFRAKCSTDLTEMSTAMKDYRKCLREAEQCIRKMENEVQKRLDEGKRNKEGIKIKLAVSTKDISDQRELLRRCQMLLDVIIKKKAERESKAVAFKKRLQDENYEEQCKLYQCNPIENDDIFICPLCSKKTQPHQGIILRECLHRFCKKCLQTHIMDSKTAQVSCPRSKDQTPCFGVILDKEIQTFGEAVNEFCEARSLSEYKDQNRFVLICGSCGNLIADDGQPRCQKPFFLCPYCDRKNCRRCKVVHEGNETCEDYQLTLPYRKIVESLKCVLCVDKEIQVAFDPCGHVVCCAGCVTKLQSKFCPYCKTPFQKTMKIYLPVSESKPDDGPKASNRK